jgi:hypothetical protein
MIIHIDRLFLSSDELGLVLNASPSNFNYDELATNQNKTFETSTSTTSTPLTLLQQKELDDEGPAFLLSHHKLGVAFWCIPYLFKYARNIFIDARQEYMKW